MLEAIILTVIALIGLGASLPVCVPLFAIVGDILSPEGERGAFIGAALGWLVGVILTVISLIAVIVHVIRIVQLAIGVPVTI